MRRDTAANSTLSWANPSTYNVIPTGGGALLFTSNSTQLQSPVIQSFGAGQPYTISAWCKPVVGAGQYRNFAYITNGTQNIYLELHNSNQFGLVVTTGSIITTTPTYAASVNGAFYHVVGVVKPATVGTSAGTVLTLYVNGVQMVTNTSLNPAISNAYCAIGAAQASGITIGVGNVAFWNRALTASEVLALYTDPFCMFQPLPTRGLGMSFVQWWLKSLSESLTLTDATARKGTKATSETYSLSDARLAFTSKATTESLSFTDAEAGKTYKAIAEALSLADAFSRLVSAAKSEGLTFPDAIATSGKKAVTETLSVTDATATKGSKANSETVALTDTRTNSATRANSEAFSLSDACVRALKKATSETLSLTDGRAAFTARQITEALSVSDAIARIVAKGILETVTFTDGRSAILSSKFIENLLLTDTRIAGVVKMLAQSLGISDSVAMLLVQTNVELILQMGAWADSYNSSGGRA